jgi:hypothetical protein
VDYPPGGKWKGDVWSFAVEGRAKNPDPTDGATGVQKSVILKWTASADAKYHDVYFGTNGSNLGAAKTRLNRGTTQYDAGSLQNPRINTQHFWRIDEVNSLTVQGYVWDFTVANYWLIESFDSYNDSSAIQAVWKPVNTSTAFILLNIDASLAVDDGNSMQFEYTVLASPTAKRTAEAKRTWTAMDWSYAGNAVKSMELDFFGDADNVVVPPLYVKLHQGATTSAQVNYYDANDVKDPDEHHWWNIPLANFTGVNLTGITGITLGTGNPAVGKAGDGTIYFDDIRLWPTRCVPAYGPLADITYDDCKVDNKDLDIMATDWLLADGYVMTRNLAGALTNFPTDNSQWVTGHTGKALNFDGVDDYVHFIGPSLKGITSMTISAWVNQPAKQAGYIGVVTSREKLTACTGDDAAELGIYGGDPGYDWPCGPEEWSFDPGFSVPINTWTFIALVVDPTGGTLYMRPAGGTLGSGRNVAAEPALDSFGEYFDIGRSQPTGGFYAGTMDDVRIYNYNLSATQVTNMSTETPSDPNPWPAYWYTFDETSGSSAANSGTGVAFYQPVQSKANLTDPEAQYSRSVNFRDYAMLADEWLQTKLFP